MHLQTNAYAINQVCFAKLLVWFGLDAPPKTQNVLNLHQDTIPYAMSQGFFFSILGYNQIDNCPQEDLAKFDYKTKYECKKKL